MTESTEKKRRARGSLSKPVILEAAKSVLREDGIEALSIRKIATHLSAGPMSIYNHYENKQDIVRDLVADFVVRAHKQNSKEEDWQKWLASTFIDIYNATIDEPEYLTLMINSDNIGIASLNIFENTLACLINAGCKPEHAGMLFHQLLSYTLGAAMLHVNINASNDNGNPTEKINSDDYPYSTQYGGLTHSIMGGSQFENTLKRIISDINF
ncbi:MAG: TetR/AcrR family transcriptional regulator [Pseudomonadales bacterium]|nr:TetR/AcrR family transcriptional regulator [Pseudomonadales bacterium]